MTTPCGADTASSIRQHTLGRSAHWRGVRRQRRTDVLVVHPAEADSGIRFVRYGEVPTTGIPARWDSVVDTRGGIVLGNTHGSTLRGAIPLLAALRVAGVDNAVVEVRGSRIAEEVSDFEFYLGMLAEVGVQAQAAARRLQRVADTVEVRDSFGFARLSPDTEFRACVNLTTIQPGGNTDIACATLVSDFTEPYAGFSATPGGSSEEKLVQAGDTGVSRPLREILRIARGTADHGGRYDRTPGARRGAGGGLCSQSWSGSEALPGAAPRRHGARRGLAHDGRCASRPTQFGLRHRRQVNRHPHPRLLTILHAWFRHAPVYDLRGSAAGVCAGSAGAAYHWSFGTSLGCAGSPL